MKARYIRTSSLNQSQERQLARSNKDEKVYTDTISGSIPFNERVQAKSLIKDCENNQIRTISVSSVDRLGRDAFDIQKTIEYFNTKGINITIDNLGIQSIVHGKTNPIFKMITDVLANVAQMEKDSIRERQLEGIAIAKKKGTYKGREKGSIETPEQILKKYPKVVKEIKMYPDSSLRRLAKNSGVSSNTAKKVKEILEEYEKNRRA